MDIALNQALELSSQGYAGGFVEARAHTSGQLSQVGGGNPDILCVIGTALTAELYLFALALD